MFRRWARTALLIAIWGGAATTWASIGHYLFGLPDMGLAMVALSTAVILGAALLRGDARAAANAEAPSRAEISRDSRQAIG